SGTDLAAALAHGADAVLVGRPYLYGLMAGGEQGVGRVHDLYRQGLLRALALLGVTSVGELGPHLLRCPPAYGPRVTTP
ncbi:alpha-hydroxy-acid oxidizing protein, partial [Halostella sp. PRR32]|uniref:alpha-hydroxy-acid oxidizing protein n=1 Tax=Halostella sp. PRR32 TaxID=3098147 RepID=UPI002B1D0224